MMMDDLEKAIFIVFDESGAIDDGLKNMLKIIATMLRKTHQFAEYVLKNYAFQI